MMCASLLQDDELEQVDLPDHFDSQRNAVVLEGRKTVCQECNNSKTCPVLIVHHH